MNAKYVGFNLYSNILHRIIYFCIVVILFLLFSCQSSYRFQKADLENRPISVFGAVEIISKKDHKVIIYTAVNFIGLREMDMSTGKPIGELIESIPDSGQEKTDTVSLSRYKTGVYFAKLNLEIGKCYSLVQLGTFSGNQYDNGNGFQTTHLESNLKKLDASESFRMMPICPKRNGVEFHGIIGVDSKTGMLYDVLKLNEELPSKDKKYVYGDHPTSFEGARSYVDELIGKMVLGRRL